MPFGGKLFGFLESSSLRASETRKRAAPFFSPLGDLGSLEPVGGAGRLPLGAVGFLATITTNKCLRFFYIIVYFFLAAASFFLAIISLNLSRAAVCLSDAPPFPLGGTGFFAAVPLAIGGFPLGAGALLAGMIIIGLSSLF